MPLGRQGRIVLLWTTHGGNPQLGCPTVQITGVPPRAS
jgi:hypothetical protein